MSSSESRQLFRGAVQVEFLARSSQGMCHTFLEVTVNVENTGSESQYDVKVIRTGNRAYLPIILALTLTKAQIWHSLASAHEVWTPTIYFTSQTSLSPHDFACAAQQLFSLLSLWHGHLRFHSHMPNSDLTVMHDPSMSSCNCACWTYQEKRSVCPPELQFDNLAISTEK